MQVTGINVKITLGDVVVITTTMNTRDEFRNVSVTVPVTEVGVAGWSWSTHAAAAASLLPAISSMQAGLVAATADGHVAGSMRRKGDVEERERAAR